MSSTLIGGGMGGVLGGGAGGGIKGGGDGEIQYLSTNGGEGGLARGGGIDDRGGGGGFRSMAMDTRAPRVMDPMQMEAIWTVQCNFKNALRQRETALASCCTGACSPSSLPSRCVKRLAVDLLTGPLAAARLVLLVRAGRMAEGSSSSSPSSSLPAGKGDSRSGLLPLPLAREESDRIAGGGLDGFESTACDGLNVSKASPCSF